MTGPTLFEIHQRGASNLRGDLPHIVVTGVIVLLTFAAISFAAFALDKRFRLYSFGTFLTMIAAGVLSVPYAARLAAGAPTPGFGVVERIDIYASLLWVAVLAIALVRLPRQRATTGVNAAPTTHHGPGA